VLLTFNVSDYYKLHTLYLSEGRQHAGMILVHQQRLSLSDQLSRLLRLIAFRSAEEMRNRVEFLGAWK